MRNLFFVAACFILALATAQPASAQKITKPKYELGGRLSALIYQGDLSPSPMGSYKSPGLGGGIFATRIIDWNWAFRMSIDYGNLKGNDSLYATPSWRRERNFSFHTSFTEIAAQFVFTLGDNYQADRLQTYVFAGAGMSFLKVRRGYNGFNSAYFIAADWNVKGLRQDSMTQLPTHCFIFPVGAGLRFGIGDYMSFFAEGTYRLMSTDYLDGFSKAANPGQLDHYTNLSVGLIYRFGDNYINCPRY